MTTDGLLRKVVFTGGSLRVLILQSILFAFLIFYFKNTLELAWVISTALVSVFMVLKLVYKNKLDIDEFIFNIVLPSVIYFFFKLKINL